LLCLCEVFVCVEMPSIGQIAGLAIGAGALAAVGVLAMRKWAGLRRPSETKKEIGSEIPLVQPRILALECQQTSNGTELFAVSPQDGLRISKPTPMIKIRRALTDGRYEDEKQNLMDIIWLQNRLIQVEFERDWILAEKASLEEVVEEKAHMVMNYVEQLLQENEAIYNYLEKETERADSAEKRAEEEASLRWQDRVQFRRVWQDHQEIAFELKSTRIGLEESKALIEDLQSELARVKRKNSTCQEPDMKPMEETTDEADQVPVELYEFYYEVLHPVVEQELADEFVLENIALTNFGRVIGSQGRRVKELEKSFEGLKVKVWSSTGLSGSVTVSFRGSDFESRREAARRIIEDLPVEVAVHLCGASLSSDLRKEGFTYRVRVTDVGNGWYRLYGRPLACQEYFDHVTSVLAVE